MRENSSTPDYVFLLNGTEEQNIGDHPGAIAIDSKEGNTGKSLVMSKELWIGAITVALGLIVENTGVQFPLTSEQIYAAGVAIMMIVRALFTQEKINKILPTTAP